MNAQDHRRWEDELGAWALGALEPAEAKRFEKHLSECERCRSDLRWLRPAVDALPSAVAQIAPPPRLRGRLLGIVRSEARREAAPGRARRWFSRMALPRPAVAALGAAALLAAGVAGYVLRGDSDQSTIEVSGSRAAPRAAGELVVEGDTGTLRARDMPRLDRDEVFQAWVAEGARIEPSTVFVPSRGGTVTATVSGVEGADRVMVTREPRGGSTQPTSAVLLRVNLD